MLQLVTFLFGLRTYQHSCKGSHKHDQCFSSFFIVITEKVKHSELNSFNHNCIKITEKNLRQQIENGDVISVIRDSFPGIFSAYKIIPDTEADINNTIH
jgi:hypothetical protein